jgi:hypothetical protein
MLRGDRIVIFKDGDWEEALLLAIRSGKPIIVFPWAQPCWS